MCDPLSLASSSLLMIRLRLARDDVKFLKMMPIMTLESHPDELEEWVLMLLFDYEECS